MKNCPPLQGRQRALGILLLQGPGWALFLMSEVPLYPRYDVAMETYLEAMQVSPVTADQFTFDEPVHF